MSAEHRRSTFTIGLLAVAAGLLVVSTLHSGPVVQVQRVATAPYAVELDLQLPTEARTLSVVTGAGLAVSVTGGVPAGLPPRRVTVRVAVPSCARLPAALDPAVRSVPSGGLLLIGVRDVTGRLRWLRLHRPAATRAAVRRLAARVCPPGSYRLPRG